MPYVDPYDHRPTDDELDSWDEMFEYTDAGVTAAKMLRTVIRELKAERARNQNLGVPAYANRENRTGGQALRYQATNRFQFRRGGLVHPTNHPQGGFTQLGEVERQVLNEPMHQYAEQDAAFTTGMVRAFQTPEEIQVGDRVMTYPGARGIYQRNDLPELHGTVLKTKKKGAVPSIKVAWDNGNEGYISGRYLKPSDLPEFTLETMEQDYDVD